jgi:hypothetical protein
MIRAMVLPLRAFVALSLCVSSAVAAHHSLTAEFDSSRRITVTGVVTKVEWMNPHVWYYADITDPQTRKVASWAFQLNSPNALAALGWARSTLKVGDTVTVAAIRSRDGSAKANTLEIRWPDGRVMPTRFPTPGRNR